MMHHRLSYLFLLITAVWFVLLIGIESVRAGPPFLTDDPQPTDLKHSELILFASQDRARDDSSVALPAFEYNFGAFPQTQLHVGLPYLRNRDTTSNSVSGIGDLELGVKYRLIQETTSLPQVSFYPMATLATGDARKGLGNGQTAWRLPLWIQKSWNEWTTYGGGGCVINHAPGQTDYCFGGWLLQRDINKWTLGGEVFTRNKDADDGRPTTILNVGGAYRFASDISALFSVGRSVSGEYHAVGYVGLQWVFGE